MFKKLFALTLAASLALSAFGEEGKITLTDKKGKESTYESLAQALKAVKTSGKYKISLPKGTYAEALYYNGNADLTISGQTDSKYGSDVIIALDNNGDILRHKASDKALKNRCLFEFEGNGNLTLENLTIHNTFERGSRPGKGTQAEALGFDSTGNLAAYNCTFKSHQDTLRTTGKAWFYQCHIEGDVDFLWMERDGKVALYEECDIVAVYDANASNHSAYVCAPRMETTPVIHKGIVILNSKITSQEGNTTYLARTPWSSGYYNQVAYINSTFSGIDSQVWKDQPIQVKKTSRLVGGWKMDKKCAENLGLSIEGRDDILDDETAAKEFGGRKSILNRKVVASSGKYNKDSKIWDTDKLAQENGWTVSPDSSSWQ